MTENDILSYSESLKDQNLQAFEEAWTKGANSSSDSAFTEGAEFTFVGFGVTKFVDKDGMSHPYAGLKLQSSDGTLQIASFSMFKNTKAVKDCDSEKVVDPASFAFSKQVASACFGKSAKEALVEMETLTKGKTLVVRRHYYNVRTLLYGVRLRSKVEFVLK